MLRVFDFQPVATDKARVTVYIPEELKERLVRYAEKERRSLSVTIELLLVDALDRKEQDSGDR